LKVEDGGSDKQTPKLAMVQEIGISKLFVGGAGIAACYPFGEAREKAEQTLGLPARNHDLNRISV
jgi:hypothetical protein